MTRASPVSLAPATSLIPVHRFLRFDAEVYDREGIGRIASFHECISKLLVNLWVSTKKIPILVSTVRCPSLRQSHHRVAFDGGSPNHRSTSAGL
jgi:hypothetical protein